MRADPYIERRVGQCRCNADFWPLFVEHVPSASKAYLGTFLKQAVVLYRQQKLTLDDESFVLWCQSSATTIDIMKIYDAFAPFMSSLEQLRSLITTLTVSNERRIALLMRHPSPSAYYLLFQEFKHTAESPNNALRQYAITLLKEGSDMSYNLVSIMQHYFQMENLPATFRLRIEPYQLSRLDEGYESFCKILLQ